MAKDEEQSYHLLAHNASSSEVLDEADDIGSPGFLHSSSTRTRGPPGKQSFIRRQIAFVKANWQFVILLSMLQSIMGMLTMSKLFPEKKDSPDCPFRDDRPSLIPNLEYEQRPEWWPTHMRELPHPWNLPPGDELDAAWNNLLWPAMFRLSKSDLHSINGQPTDSTNRVRVDTADGDYLGVLSAYHNLHCLNDIRKGLAWEEYYKHHSPEKDHAHEYIGYGHHAHCLNAIREYIMCRPDVNIVYTYEWVNDPDHFNMSAVTDTPTTCVKWDSLDRWLRPRDLHPPYPFVEPGWLRKAK